MPEVLSRENSNLSPNKLLEKFNKSKLDEYSELKDKNDIVSENRKLEIELELIEKNKGILFRECRRIRYHCRTPFDDLMQAAIVGFIKGIRSFDNTLNVPFLFWAIQNIKSCDGIQSESFNDTTVHIPRNCRITLMKELREHKDNIDECSEDSKNVSNSMECSSMDRPTNQSDNDLNLDEILPQSCFEHPLNIIADIELVNIIAEQVKTLSTIEQQIVSFMYLEDNLSLRDVGDKMNMSHENVRKIRNKAFERLQKNEVIVESFQTLGK